MNIALLMNKKDWTSIFMACICLILLLLLALIGKVAIGLMIGFFASIGALAYYQAFVKKNTLADDEQEEMLKEMRGMFGGSK
jgi:hypothetical protein